jgi:hypothetical protein
VEEADRGPVRVAARTRVLALLGGTRKAGVQEADRPTRAAERRQAA